MFFGVFPSCTPIKLLAVVCLKSLRFNLFNFILFIVAWCHRQKYCPCKRKDNREEMSMKVNHEGNLFNFKSVSILQFIDFFLFMF